MTFESENPDRVYSFAEWCARSGISESTGRRIIAAGTGPTVTWLSPRRMGIRCSHNAEWLDSRADKKTPA